MKFCILDENSHYVDKYIELNTLDELRAFANGGSGRVEIGFNEIDADGDELRHPVIRSIEYLHRGDEC